MASSDLFFGENSKESFLQQLPDLLVSARQTWNKISQDQWSDVSLAKLYDLITDITSISSLHDIEDTHAQSHAIQEYLNIFLNNGSSPSKYQIEDINNLFDKLDDAQKFNQITLMQEMGKDFPVLLYSNQGNVLPRIEEKLIELDIKPILTHSIDNFVENIKLNEPKGILIETNEISDLEELTRLFGNNEEHILDETPIIMISSEGNIQLRLAAMRSGINRYFCEPEDDAQIIDEIKLLFKPKLDTASKVLIIEDDVTQAEFASSILTKAGMETHVVTHPLKVMDSLMSFRPDIILMDIYMPDANGLELTSIIRDDLRYQATPIVFLSGETDQEKQLNALLLGADDFIMKPIRPKVLIATVQNRIKRTQELIHAIKLECAESKHSKTGDELLIKPRALGESYETEDESEFNGQPLSETETLETTIQKVINAGNIKYFYQPILCIGGVSSDNYSIIVKLQHEKQKIGWFAAQKSIEDNAVIKNMDHQITKQAIEAIVKLKSEDKAGYIFFPQSFYAIQHNLTTDWLKEKLKTSQIPGTGLVVELRFSTLVSVVKEAKVYIKNLKSLGCKVCISEFPAKKAAFKILQYVKADFIKVSSRLLETDTSVINTFVNQAHKFKSHVIVPNISDPQKINLHWTTVADYLQGEFISPEGENMNFNFSQAAM
ncbi:MAG: response regulator [Gammaproteobacteria bacterium]|jgi:PleD family two-component response regulator/EAL domain-containing protein (putative c-di-GMP-specific phosphodiesterase class I)